MVDKMKRKNHMPTKQKVRTALKDITGTQTLRPTYKASTQTKQGEVPGSLESIPVSDIATGEYEARGSGSGVYTGYIDKINLSKITEDGWHVQLDIGASSWHQMTSDAGMDSTPDGKIVNGFLYPSEVWRVKVIQTDEWMPDIIIGVNPLNASVFIPGATVTARGRSKIAVHDDYIEIDTPDLRGIESVKGDKGEPGKDGIDGLQGVQGIQGIQGIQGVPGDPLSVLAAYPIGSIYMNVNNTNPGTLFGGTWVQLKDQFLLAADDTITGSNGGNTGGAKTHTLDITEIPSHKHDVGSATQVAVNTGTTAPGTSTNGSHYHNMPYKAIRATGTLSAGYGVDPDGYWTNVIPAAGSHEHTVDAHAHQVPAHDHAITEYNKGSGAAHNNMPPYLAVYIWKRTA